MANMHPHRLAQLELELEAAQQAARVPPVRKPADELAAEAALMRAAATGANSEPAGVLQRELPNVSSAAPSMQMVPREPRAMRMQSVSKPATTVPKMSKRVMRVMKLSKAATTQTKKLLRLQIKEADREGNFGLAQKSFDELAAIKLAGKGERQAKKNDPQRLAKVANRRAARVERKDTAMANGTYVTPAERRAQRESELEARRKADPAWAAQETKKTEARKLKIAENQATIEAVARYSSYGKQQRNHHGVDQGLQGRRQIGQHAHVALAEEFQPFQRTAGQAEYPSMGELIGSYGMESTGDDSNQLEPRYDYDQEQSDAQGYQRHLHARYEPPQASLSRRMERIDIDDQSSDGGSSGDGMDVQMGGVALPAAMTGLEETTSWLPHSRMGTMSSHVQSDQAIFYDPPGQAQDRYGPAAWDSPIPAAGLAEQQPQLIRPMHGDGSKQFLDPKSTAYKMMSKMGWAQGKGLGKDGAGNPDFIPVQLKRDRKGVQERQTVVSPVHRPSAQTAAPPHRFMEPGFPINASQQTRNTRRTVIDLIEDETPDHNIKGSAGFIDLTQDVFVDLTQDGDDEPTENGSNELMPMDTTGPAANIPYQHGMSDAAEQESGLGSGLWPHLLANATPGFVEHAFTAAEPAVDADEEMGLVQEST